MKIYFVIQDWLEYHAAPCVYAFKTRSAAVAHIKALWDEYAASCDHATEMPEPTDDELFEFDSEEWCWLIEGELEDA